MCNERRNRPGRNAQQAVVEVEELLFRGYPDVVDADLADYFGSIPHAELLKSVARRIPDGPAERREARDSARCRRFAAVPVGIFTASGQDPVNGYNSANPSGVVWAEIPSGPTGRARP